MTQELRTKILAWKNEQDVIGTREVLKMKTTLTENEYLLKIKQSVKVSFNCNSQVVSTFKYFQTQAQFDNKLNKNGDLIKFDSIAKNLENDFENKYQKAVDELLSDKTEEPFE